MARPIRPIRVDGDVAYVPLTKGYEAVIDAADVPLVAGRNWRALVGKRGVYAHRTVMGADGRRSSVFLHRVILDLRDCRKVDHRDGDGLNNRRCNLRPATVQQNAMNQKIGRSNTSGFKGVCWDKKVGKWMAYVRHDGKMRFLGYHASREAAADARASAVEDLHGEFGRVA